MIQPKTPLPWFPSRAGSHEIVSRSDTGLRVVARVPSGLDLAYATHAANVLLEVTAALREAVKAVVSERHDRYWDASGDKDVLRWSAALAKAEGTP